MTLPRLTPARITTAILVACLVYLWIHAPPHGRYLLTALGAVACAVAIGASAMRGGRP